MTDHGLMMTQDNVRRILDLLKTMTRRCPVDRFKKWKVGDRIWIRESYWEYGQWRIRRVNCEVYKKWMRDEDGDVPVIYDVADSRKRLPQITNGNYWRKMPSMFMPRIYARIRAEITELREEPLQDITYDDILAEGFSVRNDMPVAEGTTGEVARLWYRQLWDSLNNKRGFAWADNPTVKVIGFKPQITQIAQMKIGG